MSTGRMARDTGDELGDKDAVANAKQSSSIPNHDTSSTIDEMQNEDEDEADLELIAIYMANGQEDVEAEAYHTAIDSYRAALELAEEHGFSKKLGFGPGDITLTLADCLLKQDRVDEAFALLVPIADRSGHDRQDDSTTTRIDTDQIVQYSACHTLGRVFLQRSEYPDAETRASQAWKGRRNLCGKGDPATIKSLQLLIDIYTAKGDTQKARGHTALLKASSKATTSKSIEGSETAAVKTTVAVKMTVAQNRDGELATIATAHTPVPTTLDGSDSTMIESMVPAALQTRKSPQIPSQSLAAIASAPAHRLSTASDNLPLITEDECLSFVQEVSASSRTATVENTPPEIPDYMRKAVLSASNLSPLPETSAQPGTSGLQPAPVTQSASQAALASIFAGSGSRSAGTRDRSKATASSQPTDSGYKPHSDILPSRSGRPAPESTPLLPVASLNSGQWTSSEPTISTASVLQTDVASTATGLQSGLERQHNTTSRTSYSGATPPSERSHTEASPNAAVPRQDFQQPSKTFSWLADTNLAAHPSAMNTTIFSPDKYVSNAVQPDSIPANVGTSSTAKKRKSLFGRSKTQTDAPKQPAAPTSFPMAGSAATSFMSSRSKSVSTAQPPTETKRQMSLASSISSRSQGLMSKDFFYGDEKPSRMSMSARSYSTAAETGSRSYEELAPRFLDIKALRATKKSSSVDLAIKLLKEYDPTNRIMNVREEELKKNMKESHKGLASTGYGYAPIHFFCEQETEAVAEIQLLIEQGVDVNAVAYKHGRPGEEPFTPLQRAVEKGSTEIVRLLVGADIMIAPPRLQKIVVNAGNRTAITEPLLIACTLGHTEVTYLLLRAGAATTLKEFPARQWHGNSLLHEACWLADPDMIKMLLDYLKTIQTRRNSSSGPDYESGIIGAPGQQDQFGATPIMYAIDLRDCPSEGMRSWKAKHRKDCLRLLIEHEIHGDLHSATYRENIASVLSTKWTRGPGKGHSVFCYCDEGGDEELVRILDPFRYQVAPGMRCHGTPQCTTIQGSSVHNGSIYSTGTEPQTATSTKIPEFATELMSEPVAWASPKSPSGGAHFELPDNRDPPVKVFEMGAESTAGGDGGGSSSDAHRSRTTLTSSTGHVVRGMSELDSETSQRSR